MDELVAAGLVTTAGRVEKSSLCYVPATGYTEFVRERFDNEERKNDG